VIGPETMNTPPLIEDETGDLIVMSPDDVMKTKTNVERGRDAGDDTRRMQMRLRIDNDVENEEREGHVGEHEKRQRRMAKKSIYRSYHLLRMTRNLVNPKIKTDRHPRGPHPKTKTKTKAKKNKEPHPPTTASCPN
jgi:hypothetical protein